MKICFHRNDLNKIVQKNIIPLLFEYTIFTFTGPLGAGKTTLIKEILKQCGITKTVKSPTFSYVNSYVGKNNHQFNHFDLYRIETLETFIDAGFDEYFYKPNNTSFIEWPEVIRSLLINATLKKKTINIVLRYYAHNQQKRILLLNKSPY